MDVCSCWRAGMARLMREAAGGRQTSARESEPSRVAASGTPDRHVRVRRRPNGAKKPAGIAPNGRHIQTQKSERNNYFCAHFR